MAGPDGTSPIGRSSLVTTIERSTDMPVQIVAIWMYLRAKVGASGGFNEAGTAVEKVILTAIFAALALAVGAIIVTKVTAKANSINLN
jgi:hypothetical protein